MLLGREREDTNAGYRKNRAPKCRNTGQTRAQNQPPQTGSQSVINVFYQIWNRVK